MKILFPELCLQIFFTLFKILNEFDDVHCTEFELIRTFFHLFHPELFEFNVFCFYFENRSLDPWKFDSLTTQITSNYSLNVHGCYHKRIIWKPSIIRMMLVHNTISVDVAAVIFILFIYFWRFVMMMILKTLDTAECSLGITHQRKLRKLIISCSILFVQQLILTN